MSDVIAERIRNMAYREKTLNAEEAKKAEAESVLKKLLAEGMSADEILAKLK